MADKRMVKSGAHRSQTRGISFRRKRKRFIPSLILRGVMLTVLLVGTSAICWTALSDISKPYIYGAQQARELTQKNKQLAELDVDNERLTRQCAYLSRPDGIENEARLKGYLKPGELSLIITAPAAPKQ